MKVKADSSRNADSYDNKESCAVATPSISLTQGGGGAIREMREKFAADPARGTGSISARIATGGRRSGFGPRLFPSYDSGAGNGPLNFGRSPSLPSISCKSIDSDVFVLSGAEDLVPIIVKNARGKWERQDLPARTVNGVTYRVDRYRPCIDWHSFHPFNSRLMPVTRRRYELEYR